MTLLLMLTHLLTDRHKTSRASISLRQLVVLLGLSSCINPFIKTHLLFICRPPDIPLFVLVLSSQPYSLFTNPIHLAIPCILTSAWDREGQLTHAHRPWAGLTCDLSPTPSSHTTYCKQQSIYIYIKYTQSLIRIQTQQGQGGILILVSTWISLKVV